MNQSVPKRWRTELQLAGVVIMWGLNFVVMKLVLSVMHPHVMNVFRLIASGSVLGIMYYVEQSRKGESFFAPLRKYPLDIIRIGLVGWAFYQVAFVLGLDKTSAGSAAIIMATVPLWTAVFAAAMGLERLTGIVWFGLLICIAGTSVVVLTGENDIHLGSEYLLGNLIMILAASLWAGYTVLTRRLVDRVSPLGLTILALIVAFPLLVGVSIPFWKTVDWSQVNWVIWTAIAFSGSLSTGIAIVFWNSAVKVMGASHTAAYQNVVPLVALLSSFLFLGERILLGQVLGGTLTIAGLIIMRRGRRTERVPAH